MLNISLGSDQHDITSFFFTFILNACLKHIFHTSVLSKCTKSAHQKYRSNLYDTFIKIVFPIINFDIAGRKSRIRSITLNTISVAEGQHLGE